MPAQAQDMSPLRPVPEPDSSGQVVLLPQQPADDPSPDPFGTAFHPHASAPGTSSGSAHH
jgi:hypothetical protein